MEKPKIHVYTICFNEEVLMPYFLRHYLSFCEKIFIYDNYSTDKSVEIASKHDNVFISQYDTGNEIRDDIYLEIKNNCWKEDKADLAIVCDMDEFLYHPNIIRFIKRFHSSGYTVAKPIAYDMFSEKLPTTPGQIYEEIKRACRHPFFDKMILFNPNKIEEMNYEPGCHYAVPEGYVKLYQKDLSLKMLHYKALSIDYILQKHRVYNSRLSKKNRENNWGHEYKVEQEQKWIDHFNKNIVDGEILAI